MNKLKIGFTDTFDGTADFFTEVLSQKYEVIRDDVNPNFLIFGDENFGTRNLGYDMNKVTKIFYTGENRRPWNYQCHFAITFDHLDTDRLYRMPLYVLNMWYLEKRLGMTPVFEQYRMPFDLDRKTEFCGFVNSNPNCVERNTFFHNLSQYKRVDSGGPLFNNIGYVLPRDDMGIKHKLDFFSTKKFSIAYENGSYPGYATEKMLEAYVGGTVPIYWGSPTIDIDFNPRCFLNRHDYVSDEEFIKKIKEVDETPSKYLEYYLEPLFTDNQPNKYMNMEKLVDWFDLNVYPSQD